MSAARYAKILSGPQAIREAEKIASDKLKDKQREWPYAWFAPPPASEHVRAEGDIVAPANGAFATVATYQVPDGMRFCLSHILLTADVGAAWVPGDGSIIFRVDINTPGAGNAQGIPFKDFQAVYVPLGSFANGPWPIIGTEQSIFESLQTIRIKVITTAAINPGAPNYIHGMLIGYTWPD